MDLSRPVSSQMNHPELGTINEDREEREEGFKKEPVFEVEDEHRQEIEPQIIDESYSYSMRQFDKQRNSVHTRPVSEYSSA